MIEIQTSFKRFLKLGVPQQIPYLHQSENYQYLFGIYIPLAVYWRFSLRRAEAIELTGVNEKNERFTPRACGYLFTGFNDLQEGESHDPKVLFTKWIEFWFKRDLRYKPAPARREKKSTRLKSTHNPTGAIPEVVAWSSADEMMFANLGVKPYSNKQGDTDLGVVEITDSIGSASRTLTVIKEARSTLSDKVMDVEKSEPFLKVKEHLDLVLTGKGEKVEELSVTSQSLKEAKEKVKQLRALQDAAKKEVEENEPRVSSAEEESCRCSDVSLVTADDLAEVETKKEHLEATVKDLVNYKLCLE
ncbi:hypothetical protein A4A49_31917 [Nicotiana attenuata]|uniref:Aminotransferase-like plant mobile domain-containing protein n=1 Tax=Nicotiana attenuata TaxID=49451 RepID=A0A1J6KZY9_NICAT|nr:hypothetical protein A4A49_31917 [Nicotiana attenuata]